MVFRTRRAGRPGHARFALVCLTAGASVLLVAGCSGQTESVSKDRTPDQVMAESKQILDDTAGVELTLSTSDLPDDVDGVVDASGYANHQPAFDGTIKAALSVLGGSEVDIPVVAVDDKVYAKLPLTPGYRDIDPDDYGVPDPGQLLSPDTGVSSLLVASTDLTEGDAVRGGDDNDEVLTEYTGSLPADAVSAVIPSASGDFDVTFTVADSGELREAVITGQFYPEPAATNTYDLKLSDYDTEKTVTAP